MSVLTQKQKDEVKSTLDTLEEKIDSERKLITAKLTYSVFNSRELDYLKYLIKQEKVKLFLS